MPPAASVKKRKKTPACDACALRKIKCEELRPCRYCRDHSLDCGVYREIKKAGPKGVRRKTLEALSDLRRAHERLKWDSAPQESPESSEPQHPLSDVTAPHLQPLRSTVPLSAPPPRPRPAAEIYAEHPPALFLDLPAVSMIPASHLLFNLDVYHRVFYPIFPILPREFLQQLRDAFPNLTAPHQPLTPENIGLYGLACAVSASMASHAKSLQSNPDISHFQVEDARWADLYIPEVMKIRALADLRPGSKIISGIFRILIAFFLTSHYLHTEGSLLQAVLYVREAISLVQLLGLDRAGLYRSGASGNSALVSGKYQPSPHFLKKVFYVLFVVERYLCLEDRVPVILDNAHVPLPEPQEDDFPDKLEGFLKLLAVFSTPDKSFFDCWACLVPSGSYTCGVTSLKWGRYDAGKGGMPNSASRAVSPAVTSDWAVEMATRLSRAAPLPVGLPAAQKVDVVVTNHWLRALAWYIAYDNGLTDHSGEELGEQYLSFKYPLEILVSFYESIAGYAVESFEIHGFGLIVKMLEIANPNITLLRDFIEDGEGEGKPNRKEGQEGQREGNKGDGVKEGGKKRGREENENENGDENENEKPNKLGINQPNKPQLSVSSDSSDSSEPSRTPTPSGAVISASEFLRAGQCLIRVFKLIRVLFNNALFNSRATPQVQYERPDGLLVELFNRLQSFVESSLRTHRQFHHQFHAAYSDPYPFPEMPTAGPVAQQESQEAQEAQEAEQSAELPAESGGRVSRSGPARPFDIPSLFDFSWTSDHRRTRPVTEWESPEVFFPGEESPAEVVAQPEAQPGFDSFIFQTKEFNMNDMFNDHLFLLQNLQQGPPGGKTDERRTSGVSGFS